MASIDDPETWEQWSKVDDEFAQMMENKVPRRFPPVDLASLPDVRQAWVDKTSDDMKQILKDSDDKVEFEEIFIPLSDGTFTRSLVFKPKRKLGLGSPLMVLIHGGGFVFGVAEMEARACIESTKTHGCVSISIDYRLAPETKFPVAYNDCWEILLWITKNQSKLGADLEKGFVLGGTSSGGHMTAALTHWARDRNLSPPLTGVYLNVPAIVLEENVPEKYLKFYRSRKQNGGKVGLSKKTEAMFDEAVKPDRTSELWNPLNWHSGHHDLPKTYFQVCGTDIIRDDALIYERALRLENGIQTKWDIYPGLPHVFWYMYPSHSATSTFHSDTIRGIGWLLSK